MKASLSPWLVSASWRLTVDVLVGPALGRHGVDKTNLNTGKALRHGGHIADDIGDAEVVPGLFPIGWARPAHL